MNDFDFEELDKAVNKLATKTEDEHDSLDPKAAPSVTPTPAASVSVGKPTLEVKTDAAVQTQADSAKPTPLPPQSPPQKRPVRLSDTRPRNRGAFMDIVPPTSSRRFVERAGVSVQPLSKPEDIIPEESKSLAPEASAPATSDEPSSEPIETPKIEVPTSQPDAIEVTTPDKKSDEVSWPDPLDFGNDRKEQPVEKNDERTDTPLTPFLAEAKVEKRPLGAFSNFKSVTDDSKVEEQAPASEAPKPQEELSPPDKTGTFKEPVSVDAKTNEKSGESSAVKPTDAPEEPPKPDLHGAAMMSIPQQYHTEAKSTDKAARPIFDTKEYHPPLLEATSHDHRGGGVWGKIFIAFVTLVLLAVAGYFAYLYIAQQ